MCIQSDTIIFTNNSIYVQLFCCCLVPLKHFATQSGNCPITRNITTNMKTDFLMKSGITPISFVPNIKIGKKQQDRQSTVNREEIFMKDSNISKTHLQSVCYPLGKIILPNSVCLSQLKKYIEGIRVTQPSKTIEKKWNVYTFLY